MKIGFIGLGSMGSLMSAQLVRSGYEVIGYDILPAALAAAAEHGVVPAANSAEVAAQCDTIVCMMPQSSDTRQALFGEHGVHEHLRPGMLILDMSTGAPTDTKEMHARLKAQGVAFVDAPVSGGVVRAADGTLSIMASGDREDYERALEIFNVLGKSVFYVGESGTGHTIKLINNMLTGINLAGICEAMVMGMKAGLDPELLLSIINSSSGMSYSSKMKMENFVFPRNFNKGFKVRLQLKDMKLASDLAKDVGAPTMLGNVAKEYYMAAYAAGMADEDASAIVKLLENVCHVEVVPQPHIDKEGESA